MLTPTTTVKIAEADDVVVAAAFVAMVATTVVHVGAAPAAVYVDANATTSVGIVGATATCVDSVADNVAVGSTIAATVADDASDASPP
jgi:hypothetical protein